VRDRTAQLEASRAELKRLNEQKNQLLGMAAHDLRNPLTVVRGYADILTQQFLGPLNAQQEELLRRICASSRHMVELVNDLLDVSKIEAGRLDLHPEPTDLQEVVRSAVENCLPLAAPKKIELALSDHGPLPATVDRRRIEQVLNNLLDNAIKYSFSGSRVEIGLQRSSDEAIISVKDRGRGITAEQTERLFQAFGTDGKPGTEGEKATGLGLAIAHRMIQAHGGRIWVESEVGAGSRFHVALPLSGTSPTPGGSR
jgi:signal transduction histidine kinase